MRLWHALQPSAGMAALFALSMFALWLLVSNGVTFAVVPPPEIEAESLVRALKAKRFNAVRSELIESIKEEATDARLAELAASIRDARGEESNIHGDTATATVKVKLEDNTEETIELPLLKEHGLWRVTSIDPLGRLKR